MNINQEFYLKAQRFVESQVNLSTCIYSVPVGFGHTNFCAPAIYIPVPSDPKADHTECLCALFHEYGHWLEMELWIEQNLQNVDARLCAIKYCDHLLEIGVLQSPGNPINKDAQLQSERSARQYGRDGLLVGDYFHKALIEFDATDSIPKGFLLAKYEEYSDKMFETYL